MGNSGATLEHAVLKRGPEAVAEGEYCQLLGTIAPRILAVGDDYYVMENLRLFEPNLDILRRMEQLLFDKLWCRDPIRGYQSGWLDHVDFCVPDRLMPTYYCLTHGDPTIGNVLYRDQDTMIIADPRPPRPHVPESPDVDRGKMLQSVAGWEWVAYGQRGLAHMHAPDFWQEEDLRQRALFWCGMAAHRILLREYDREEKRQHVVEWCVGTKEVCFNEAGL